MVSNPVFETNTLPCGAAARSVLTAVRSGEAAEPISAGDFKLKVSATMVPAEIVDASSVNWCVVAKLPAMVICPASMLRSLIPDMVPLPVNVTLLVVGPPRFTVSVALIL